MQILTAENGITVIYRQLTSRLVSFKYTIKCGSVDEQEEKEYGLCHALEHMFYSGTLNRDWEKIQKDFYRLGAYSNAYTSIDHTAYEVVVPVENFEKAFEIAADLMYNPIFLKERWENVEKYAIINEILQQRDDPSWLLQTYAFEDALGKDYHDPGGLIKSIQKAKVPDLISFKDRFYKGENVFLVVAGGISQEDMLKIVNKYDKWEATAPNKRCKKIYSFNDRKLRLKEKGKTEPTIVNFLSPLPSPTKEKDIFLYSLTEKLLNAHLMNEVREKRGLSYGVMAEVDYSLPGLVLLFIDSSANNKKELRILRDGIQNSLRNFPDFMKQADTILQGKMELYRNMLLVENCTQTFSADILATYLAGFKKCEFDIIDQYLYQVSDEEVINTCKLFVDRDFKITTL